MRTVLTIAGFDPSSGAGITADLMVFSAHGLFGASAITALTVQSTRGVRSVHATEAAVLSDTLHTVFDDLQPAGIKIGMIGSAANVQIIAEFLKYARSCGITLPIVLDPVLRSSSGKGLLDGEGEEVFRHELLPLVDWVTPNTSELAWLSGVKIELREQVSAAARELQVSTARPAGAAPLGVIATGGHLEPPDDLLLSAEGDEVWFSGERVHTRSTHGTGCAFSSAFLSRLVLGESPARAARAAKDYVAGALKAAPEIGHGAGPMNLLWPLTVLPRG